ncbi:hypothetical protein FRC03_000029 [Tulasnella sp. 419]|nr:hypothetical protein FRC03_000029 [Tulasnella sp. 419]
MSNNTEDPEACPACKIVSEDISVVKDQDGNLIRGLRRCFNARCRVKWYEVANLAPTGRKEIASVQLRAPSQLPTPIDERFDVPERASAPKSKSAYSSLASSHPSRKPSTKVTQETVLVKRDAEESLLPSKDTQGNVKTSTTSVLKQRSQVGTSGGNRDAPRPANNHQNDSSDNDMVTVFVRGVETRSLQIRIPAFCDIDDIFKAIRSKSSIPVNANDFYLVRVREGKLLHPSWTGSLLEGETLQASFRVREP